MSEETVETVAATETPAKEKGEKSKRSLVIREKARAAVKQSGKKWADLSKDEKKEARQSVRTDMRADVAKRREKRAKKTAAAETAPAADQTPEA